MIIGRTIRVFSEGFCMLLVVFYFEGAELETDGFQEAPPCAVDKKFVCEPLVWSQFTVERGIFRHVVLGFLCNCYNDLCVCVELRKG